MANEVQALDDLGALSFFEPILASDLEGVEKPQREIFLRACERAGVRPSETVHVGDELKWYVVDNIVHCCDYRLLFNGLSIAIITALRKRV